MAISSHMWPTSSHGMDVVNAKSCHIYTSPGENLEEFAGKKTFKTTKTDVFQWIY